MGYSHYLKIKNEDAARALPAVARDLRALLERNAFPFPLAGPTGEGEPEIGDAYVAFNGVRPDQDYETCLLDPAVPSSFTKTGPGRSERRPYDLAVMVAYTLWRWHAGGNVAVDSDGGLVGWEPATQLIVREFGYPVDPYYVLERRLGLYRAGELTLWVEEPLVTGDGKRTEMLMHLSGLPEILRDPYYAPAGSPAATLAKRLPPRLEPKTIERIGESDVLPPSARPLAPELPGYYFAG